MSEIAVVGAGAWGTRLSIVLGRKGTHRVRLWAHEKEVRDSIQRAGSMIFFFRETPSRTLFLSPAVSRRHSGRRHCR